MDKDKNKHGIENLERVITLDLEYLDRAAEDILTACLGALALQDVPPAVLESILKEHGFVQMRLAEIESVQAFLFRRYNRRMPEDPQRRELINELDTRIAELSARLQKESPPATASPAPAPSERWLRIDDNSLAFTINARLLDELEYEPSLPGELPRVVQQTGRGFTLFTLRGPATALDSIMPCFKLRQHDIVERFSATEIRGVLTHLRQISLGDTRHIFDQLLASRFTDVKCVLVGLHSPDRLDEHFQQCIDRTVEDMPAGEIWTIDLS